MEKIKRDLDIFDFHRLPPAPRLHVTDVCTGSGVSLLEG